MANCELRNKEFLFGSLPQSFKLSRAPFGSLVVFSRFKGRLVWTGSQQNEWFVLIDFEETVPGGCDGVVSNQQLYHSQHLESCLLMSPNDVFLLDDKKLPKKSKTCSIQDCRSVLYHNHVGCKIQFEALNRIIDGILRWCGTIDSVYWVVVELSEIIEINTQPWQQYYRYKNKNCVLIPARDVVNNECYQKQCQHENQTCIPTEKDDDRNSDYDSNSDELNRSSRTSGSTTESATINSSFVFCDLPINCNLHKTLLGSVVVNGDHSGRLVWTGRRADQYFILTDFGQSVQQGSNGEVDGQRLYHGSLQDSCLLTCVDEIGEAFVENKLPEDSLSCTIDDPESPLYRTHMGCVIYVRSAKGYIYKGRLCWCGTINGEYYAVLQMMEGEIIPGDFSWKLYYSGDNQHEYALFHEADLARNECLQSDCRPPPSPPIPLPRKMGNKKLSTTDSRRQSESYCKTSWYLQPDNVNTVAKFNVDDQLIYMDLPDRYSLHKNRLGSVVQLGQETGRLVWTGCRGETWLVLIDFGEAVENGVNGVFSGQTIYDCKTKNSCRLIAPESVCVQSKTKMPNYAISCGLNEEDSPFFHLYFGFKLHVRLPGKNGNQPLPGLLCWCGKIGDDYYAVVELCDSSITWRSTWDRYYKAARTKNSKYVIVKSKDIVFPQPPKCSTSANSPNLSYADEE